MRLGCLFETGESNVLVLDFRESLHGERTQEIKNRGGTPPDDGGGLPPD